MGRLGESGATETGDNGATAPAKINTTYHLITVPQDGGNTNLLTFDTSFGPSLVSCFSLFPATRDTS